MLYKNQQLIKKVVLEFILYLLPVITIYLKFKETVSNNYKKKQLLRYDLIELGTVSRLQVDKLAVSIDFLELVLIDMIEFFLPKITSMLFVQFEDYSDRETVKKFCRVFEEKLLIFDRTKLKTEEIIYIYVVHQQSKVHTLSKNIFMARISQENDPYVKHRTASIFKRAVKNCSFL